MAYIEPGAMAKLTASLREKGRADLAQAQRRQLQTRSRRRAALDFDIQQAMRAGDLEAAQKLQQASYRADALDRGELAGVRAAQDFDVREAEGAERRRVEKNDAFRPLGGVTTRAGPVTAENTIVLPAGIARGMLRGPSATMVNQEAQRRADASGRGYLTREDYGNVSGRGVEKRVGESQFAYARANIEPRKQQEIAFARQDEAMRKKPVLSPDVLATRKAGADWAARTAQSDLGKAPAVAIDEYWRPDVNQTLSRGGTIWMGGKAYSAQAGKNKEIPFVPPPRRRRQPTANVSVY